MVEFCSNNGGWGGYRRTFVCLADSYETGLREGIKFAKQLYPEADWSKNLVTIDGTDMWISVKDCDVVQ